MDLGIPPFKTKNLLESIPLKSRFLLRGLTVGRKTYLLFPPRNMYKYLFPHGGFYFLCTPGVAETLRKHSQWGETFGFLKKTRASP